VLGWIIFLCWLIVWTQDGGCLTITEGHTSTDADEVEDGEYGQGNDVPLVLLYSLVSFLGMLGD
jgi:hypothetical protein